MNTKMNFNFLNKFSHYLLIGLSSLVLFAGVQSGMVGDFTQRGPNQALADFDCVPESGLGCANPGTQEEPIFPDQPAAPVTIAPITQPVTQPAPAPGPSCGDFGFKYNECFDCKKSRAVYQDSCGVYKTEVNSGEDQACVSWCPAEVPVTPAYASPPYVYPTPAAPAQVCTPNQFDANQCRRCAADGTFWGTPGSDFGPNNGSGEWCGCAQRYNQSAYNQYCQAVTPPQQPNPPSCPTDIQICPGGSAVSRNPAAGCQFYACPNVPSVVCVPTTCSAATPACGQRTTGVDNCGNGCSRSGSACGAPICIPNNTCSAPAPTACGQTTTGVDNCNNRCTRSAAACTPPAAPITITTGNTTNSNPTTVSNPISISHPTTVTVSVPAGGAAAPAAQQQVREIIREVQTFGNVGVAQSAQFAAVKQLPSTGLPALAWAAAAFVPAGFRIRRFSKVKEETASKPHFLWEERQFKV